MQGKVFDEKGQEVAEFWDGSLINGETVSNDALFYRSEQKGGDDSKVEKKTGGGRKAAKNTE